MRKRGLCCGPVSVCPSLTLVHCIHTAENIVEQELLFRPGSSLILVFLLLTVISRSRYFSTLNVSETARDIAIVSIECQ